MCFLRFLAGSTPPIRQFGSLSPSRFSPTGPIAAFIPRFPWTLAVLVLLIVLGTLGYVLIEQQPRADVLYMTVITVTAVGYSEVFDLTPTGRTFTIILLLCGISWMGFWFANITSFIVELDLKDALKRRRNM